MLTEILKMGDPTWVISILLIGLLTVLLVKVTKIFKWFMFYQALPGLKEFSVIHGNLHMLPKTADSRLQHGVDLMHRFNKKYHRFWIGPITPVIYVYHPDLVKAMLLSSAPKSRGFGSVIQLLNAWVGEGLVVANGGRWARSRRLLTPAFHFDILKPYMAVYNEGADNMFKQLDKLAESGEGFDICPFVRLYTLEGILKCAFSYKADVQTHGHPYATAVQEVLDIVTERVREPLLWLDWVFRHTAKGKKFFRHCDFMHRFAEEAIEQRKKTLEKDGVPKGRYLDFIDILLTAKDEDGNSMSNLEIRNEVNTFMFAGHDTTACAIPWCLYTLSKYPEYQDKIRQEVDAILEGRDDDEIKWSDLPALKTLSICIKEAVRLYPPVPFIQRQLKEEMVFDGHLIPPGTFVTIAIHHLHRNPDVWDHPNDFRPERFNVDNARNKDPFAYLPFSAGSRNCIGQNFALNETKVLISRILRRYVVRLDSSHGPPTRNPIIVLRPEDGIWLTLERRDTKKQDLDNNNQ